MVGRWQVGEERVVKNGDQLLGGRGDDEEKRCPCQ